MKNGKVIKHPNGDGRVLGVFHKDSAIGYVASILEDEKLHDLIDVMVDVTKKTKTLTPYFMLRRMREYVAKRGVAELFLDPDKKTVRMKVLPRPEPEPEPEPPKIQLALPANEKKQALTLQTLVRRELFEDALQGTFHSSTGITNKLMRKFAEMDPKRIKRAIHVEIKRGGLKAERGVLHLTN